MRVLALDAGNTAIKSAVFEGDRIISTSRVKDLNDASFTALFSKMALDGCIWSSVGGNDSVIESMLRKHIRNIRMTASTPVPVNNQYATPATLGTDRLAAMVGADTVFPGHDVLVINMGTTVTYDHISAAKAYSGGSISPGLNMRFAALGHFTARLPKVEADGSFPASPGTDTRSSIVSGVQNGLLYELNGFMSAYRDLYPDLRIILTGGDAPFFASLLKKGIFAPFISFEPDLVLIGLNTVYHYNDQHA